jgi:hypothetical protein
MEEGEMPKSPRNIIALAISMALGGTYSDLQAVSHPVLNWARPEPHNQPVAFDDSGVTVIADGWDDEDTEPFDLELFESDNPFEIASLHEEQITVLAYGGGYGGPKVPCRHYGGVAKLLIDVSKKGVIQGATPGAFTDSSVNPDGSVTLPDGGTIKHLPDGGIELPDGGIVVRLADGNVQLPDGSVLQAGGNLAIPSGEIYIRLADGGLQVPDGSVVTRQSDGTVRLPDGSVIMHLSTNAQTETISLPDGTQATVHVDTGIRLSNGYLVRPDGRVILPDGSDNSQLTTCTTNCSLTLTGSTFEREQDGSINLPNGYVLLQPDGYVRLPNGYVVQPDGGVKLPNGYVLQADGSVRLPDGNALQPDGGVRLLNGNVMQLDGTVLRANGDIIQPGGAVSVNADNLVLNCGKSIPKGVKGYGGRIYGGRICKIKSCKSYGDVYDLKAVPEPGFEFIKWKGSSCKAQGSNPICTVSLNKAKRKVSAKFKRIK